MAEVADESEPDNPLTAHVDAISPAGRSTTAAQEHVLDVVHRAARAGSRAG